MQNVSAFLLSGLCAVVIGCSDRTQPLNAGASKQLYTEDEVRKFVVPGTARQAILDHFGAPTEDDRNPKFEDGSTNIDEILFFQLPPPSPPTNEDFVFSGFQVRLKNGIAVDWASTHSTIQINR
jgi:hypothetical protein